MNYKLGALIKKTPKTVCGKGDYPVLSITKNSGLILQSERFKKQIASVDQSKYLVVKRGQLVLSIHLDDGVLGVQDVVEEGIVSPAYKIWDINTNIVKSKYLEYLLKTPKSIEYYKSKAQSSVAGRCNVRDTDLLQMEVNIPSLMDQEKALSLIELAGKVLVGKRREIQKLDDSIKGRFVELFGDPEINQYEWPESQIGDNCFVTKLAGFEYTKYIHYSDSGDVVMVKAQNVKNGAINQKGLSYISNEVSDSLPRSQLAPGDVVMTYVGANIGDVAIIDDKHKYHLAPNVAKIRPDNEVYDPVFFMYLLMMKTDYIVRNSADTAKAALGMGRIRALRVFTPPIEMQKQFSAFVAQANKTKTVMQKTLEKTQLLFDSLMQEYFG